MKKETTKKRPCRPGDVLFRLKTDFGAEAIVKLGFHVPHPPSGTCVDRSIMVLLEVRLPAIDHGNVLMPAIQALDRGVLGHCLCSSWGATTESKKHRACYANFVYRDVVTGFGKAVEVAKESLATVQEVFDAHKRSVEELEQYRKDAFDAFWVDEDASNPEGGSNA